MESYLNDNNIPFIVSELYKIKFEIFDVTYHYSCSSIKNYHHMIIYMPEHLFETNYHKQKKYSLKLLGVIDSMNMYKFEIYCSDLNKIIDIVENFY